MPRPVRNKDIVRSLASLLKKSGFATEAKRLRELAKADPTPGDVAEALAVVQSLQAPDERADPAPPSEDAQPLNEAGTPESPPVEPLPDVSGAPPSLVGGLLAETDESSPELDPWIDALPSGRAIAALLARLERTISIDDVREALSTLFVDILRFDSSAADETSRLGGMETIRRLFTIAKHDSFSVTLAELPFPYEYASTFEPIFRRHPFGLVVAVSPNWNSCKFVFRGHGGQPSTEVRTFSGRGRKVSLDEDIATWTWRVAQLRPQDGERGRELAIRVSEALTCEIAVISDRWATVEFTTNDTPPARSWVRAQADARGAFLGEGRSSAVIGLEGLSRALRAGFPISINGRAGRLALDGFSLGGELLSKDDAVRQGKCWTREITLRLCVVDDDVRVEEFEFSCAVLEIDEQGRSVIDGSLYRYTPIASVNGRITEGGIGGVGRDSESEITADEALAEIEGVVGEPGDQDGAFSASLEHEDAPFDEEPESTRFSASNHRAIFEFATIRKLGGIARRLEQYTDPPASIARSLRAVVRPLVPRDEPLLLQSKRFLASVLSPVRQRLPEDLLPVVRCEAPRTGVDIVPVWACVDAALSLPRGLHLPVAGARVGPGGELFVPIESTPGRYRLGRPSEDAWRTNGRVRTKADGTDHWWVAPQLQMFSALSPGVLAAPAALAARGRRLQPLKTSSIPGKVLVAQTSRLGSFATTEVLRQVVTVPALIATSEESPCQLLTQPGAAVRPGVIWLQVPSTVWIPTRSPKKQPHAPLQVALATLTASDGAIHNPPASATAYSWRVPPGCHGTVKMVSCEPVRDRSRAIVAWRACLDVECARSGGYVILADGRAAPLVAMEGCDVDLVISDPLQTETSPPKRATPLAFLPRSGDEIVQPDLHLRFRARDGQGIPSAPTAAGLSARDWQWWVAADPGSASAVATIEAAWTAGQHPVLWRLADVLLAASVVTPPWIEVPWDPNSSREESAKVDYRPQPNVMRAQSRRLEETDLLPAVWRCECRRVQGTHRAFEVCSSCNTRVRYRRGEPTARAMPVTPLPEPVPHPWRLQQLADVLARQPDQVIRTFVTKGGHELYRRTLKALCDRGKPTELRGELFLANIRHLTPRLHPTGLPPPAPALVKSPLSARYLRVQQALERYSRVRSSGVELLVSTGRSLLFQAIAELFGDADSGAVTGEPQSLANLITRLWPWTRAGGLRTSPPGLFRIEGAADHRRLPEQIPERRIDIRFYDPWREIEDPNFGEPPRDHTQTWPGLKIQPVILRRSHPEDGELGVASTDAIRLMPARVEVRRPGRLARDEYRRRVALTILEDSAPALSALFTGFASTDSAEHRKAFAAATGDTSGGEFVSAEAAVQMAHGSVAELITAARSETAAPSAVVSLLAGAGAMTIPDVRADAWQRINKLLAATFPGDGRLITFARHLLCAAFVGWSYGDGPKDWRWDGAETAAPRRRIAPALDHSAWETWPDFRALKRPVRFFLDKPTRCPPFAAPAFGLEMTARLPEVAPHPPVLLDPSTPRQEPAPEPAALSAASSSIVTVSADATPGEQPPGEVRILDGRADSWLSSPTEAPTKATDQQVLVGNAADWLRR